MTGDTFLTRISLDRRATIRAAARGRAKNADPGYLLHSALSLIFAASDAPADVPFSCFAWDDIREKNMSWQERDRTLPLLAYSSSNDEALRASMGHQQLVRSLETKRAPELPAGSRCDFRVRVCPVVRTRRAGNGAASRDGKKQGRGKSRELDAFVHAKIDEPSISREAAYASWLQKQFADSATLIACHITELRTDLMHRKGGGPFTHPNVVLEGTLTVSDDAAFGAKLARGIGRHRAFGFGMLLIRPAT